MAGSQHTAAALHRPLPPLLLPPTGKVGREKICIISTGKCICVCWGEGGVGRGMGC